MAFSMLRVGERVQRKLHGAEELEVKFDVSIA
jgi:hypothetical protein